MCQWPWKVVANYSRIRSDVMKREYEGDPDHLFSAPWICDIVIM